MDSDLVVWYLYQQSDHLFNVIGVNTGVCQEEVVINSPQKASSAYYIVTTLQEFCGSKELALDECRDGHSVPLAFDMVIDLVCRDALNQCYNW